MTEHAQIPRTTEEVRQAYDANASLYALFEPVAEYLGLRRLRRRLLQKASGDVLEVAVGTGANLRYYPRGCRITAVDISEAMLTHARREADRRDLQVDFRLMDAEQLDFPDNHFDTVASAMTVCTFIRPVAALQEMNRVCKPDGKILLLEHGRSSTGWIAKWQDRGEARHAEKTGCHWNREPLALVKESGLNPVSSRRSFFGVFHEIIARPEKTLPPA